MAENGGRKGDAALVLALAGGHTVRDAARLAGVGERTASRRVADATFRRWVVNLRSDMVARGAGHLADGMAEAAATMRSLLKSPTETVRLAAARAVLELGNRLHEAAELEARVRELEAQMDASRNGGQL